MQGLSGRGKGPLDGFGMGSKQSKKITLATMCVGGKHINKNLD